MIATEIKLRDIGLSFEDEEKEHIHKIVGIPVTGVTSVTDLCPKPFLVAWSAKMCAEYIKSKWVPNGLYSQALIDEICLAGKMNHQKRTERGADIGTQVHSLIELYIKDKTLPIPALYSKEVINCFDKFLQWESEHKVEWIFSERQIGSVEHQFAGILDEFALVDGRYTLIDNKTSKTFGGTAWYIQTAGYLLAMTEMIEDEFFNDYFHGKQKVEDGKQIFANDLCDRRILWIPKEGDRFTCDLVPTSFEQDKATFLALLQATKLLRKYKEEDIKIKEVKK